MKWEEALQRGGTAPDVLHSTLRAACMRGDKAEVEKILKESEIPLDSFNGLIYTILEYHNKSDMIKFLKGLQ